MHHTSNFETHPIPLEGKVCAQFVRCGKTICRCQAGELHGPYFYRVWRVGARIRKVYVKAAEVETVRAQCDLHHQLTQNLHTVRRNRVAMTQRILREWRRTQRL